MDSALLHLVVQLRAPWLDDVMVSASALGSAGFVWLVIGVVGAIYPGHRAAAWRLLLAMLLTTAVVDGTIKPLVNRVRPFEADPRIQLLGGRPASASFPSGHAARAFAGAVAATAVFPAATWAFWPAALVISFSRVYVGVHWPTDVIAGAVVGLVCAWFVLGRRVVLRA